jgi:hypothetical protein
LQSTGASSHELLTHELGLQGSVQLQIAGPHDTQNPGMAVKTHEPPEQLSAVQGLLSLQTIGTKLHPPLLRLQESRVQVLLSLHTTGTKLQSPVAEAHESVVQLLLSLQIIG